MNPLPHLAPFFAGAFLCNALPHLAAGVRGEPFPTPFAKPRGVGDSSPVVNFLWGFANLVAGLALLRAHPFALGMRLDGALFFLGVLLLGTAMAWRFGEVRRNRK
ncbi:hypothetical protein SAMN05444156_1788 [Verrucomicrobium sp. GAS474]|uniref:hypothetical protein n=1 Tax=Verrucomicrobium sp. GAS474 TaxID=1882831 RepID=UPI00087C5C18|nr:hypothetical protein [Verrucomicrobium sp. GAS474]SDU07072.1 hypothetical protein SAMN05444156_1788 [Verrucomicrobium sp. GAS474]